MIQSKPVPQVTVVEVTDPATVERHRQQDERHRAICSGCKPTGKIFQNRGDATSRWPTSRRLWPRRRKSPGTGHGLSTPVMTAPW